MNGCRPLIRIIGDRFPWQVKSAILSTLGILISKGGISLKPFLPQLQTTFVKCLQDNTRFKIFPNGNLWKFRNLL
jgi:hypothetical protein